MADTRRHHPDDKWRWVVVAACFTNMFILYGLYKMSGMLFVATMDAFGETRERAAWPYTLCNSVFQCIGIVAGILAHNFGIRKTSLAGAVVGTIGTTSCYFGHSVLWLTVFYGFVFGFGFGIIAALIPVIVNQYFHQNKSVATGIAYSGSTCGSLLLPVVIEIVLDNYGFRGSFLILGGLVMNLLVPCALLREPNNQQRRRPLNKKRNEKLTPLSTNHEQAEVIALNPRHLEPELQKDEEAADSDHLCTPNHDVVRESLQVSSAHPKKRTDNVEKHSQLYETLKTMLLILKSPVFWITVVSSVTFMYAVHSFYTVIIDFAVDKGVHKYDAKYLISAASLGSLGGRLFLGWITDKQVLSRKNYTMISLALFCVSVGCFPLVSSFSALLILTVVYGILEGGIIIMYPVLLADYFGRERHAISFGMLQALNGCMSIVRPSMIGHFRDMDGSYDGLFWALAVMTAIGAMAWLAEPLGRRYSPGLVPEQAR